MIYTGRVVAGSMEPPPLVKLGAKSEELLFASPRLAQATSYALSLVSTLAFIANNTRMLHN